VKDIAKSAALCLLLGVTGGVRSAWAAGELSGDSLPANALEAQDLTGEEGPTGSSAAAVTLGGAPTPAPAEANGPTTYGTMKFDGTAFDFGDVYRGMELTHRFRFTNAGPGPLTIQGVHAACGCTVAEVEKGRRYQPGESGFVEVRLDTTDFSGELVKSVTVMSNEKLLPDRTLTLKAMVRTEIEADPPLVDFGDVRSQDGATRVVKVKVIGDKGYELKELLFNRDLIEAAYAPAAGEGPQAKGKGAPRAWDVTVKLKPGIRPGFLKELLVVRNTSPHLQELPVPLRAVVLGNIDFTPAYLEFGAIAPADVAKRSITMHSTGAFEIVGTRAELIVNGRRADDAAKYLKIDPSRGDGGKDKRLVSVELKNQSKVAGSVHGKLYFQTTDAAQRELAIDFYAFFR
jgi:hypothetical protein